MVDSFINYKTSLTNHWRWTCAMKTEGKKNAARLNYIKVACQFKAPNIY